MLLLIFTVGRMHRSLWFDEAATYQYATLSLPRLWDAMHLSDAFYFAYYVVMHGWIMICGASEIALRIPSLAAAVLVLVFTADTMRRLISTRAAIISAAFIAVCPFFDAYAVEARPYMPMVLAVTIGTWIAVRSSIDAKPRRFSYGAACLAGVFLHCYALPSFLAHAVYLWYRKQRGEALITVALITVVTILFSPLALMAVHDVNSQNAWLTRPRIHDIPSLFWIYSGGRVWMIYGVFILGAIVAAVRQRRSRPAAVLLAAMVLLPIVMVWAGGAIRSDFRPPYMIATLVPFLALAAIGPASLAALPSGALAALAVILEVAVAQRTKTLPDQDWRSVAGQLGQTDADIMIFPREGASAFDYYSKADRRVVYPASSAIENSSKDYLPALPSTRRLIVIFDSLTHADPMEHTGSAEFIDHIKTGFREHASRSFPGLEEVDYER